MQWSILFSGDASTGAVGYTMTADIPNVPVGVILKGVLACCAGDLSSQALQGLTVASPAPVVLPDGWEPTLDGVNVEMRTDTGARSYSRTYRLGEEGEPVSAPCAEDGSPLPETVAVLSARSSIPLVEAVA